MSTQRDVQKYLDYIFDHRSFEYLGAASPSADAIEAAARIRGTNRGPAIMIHGIMPRSGTVYVGELLRYHPDLHAYPREFWEAPFLGRTADIEHLQQAFLWTHVHNEGKIGDNDFQPLFGASLIAYLHAVVPESKRVLLKVSGVQYLDRFFDVFPHEALLLLVRDGRDVVHSTVKTWPQIRFWMACLRWKRAAKMSLYVKNRFGENKHLFWFGRFEDAIDSPKDFATAAFERLGLDAAKYPWESIDETPVMGSSSLDAPGEVKWEPVEKPAGFKPTGHWRNWSAYRRIIFKAIAGESLVSLGYGREEQW